VLDPAAETTVITMRDGVRLHGDLFRAHERDPAPVVLIRLPYGTARGYTYMPQVAHYLTRHGFTVLIQDVRGRFRSEGNRTPCVHEVMDGYDTIDWLADQPWCTGAVGMLGTSYYGFTQWAAAASGHPALKALVPRYTCHLIPPPVAFARDEVGWAPDAINWITGIWSTGGMLARGDESLQTRHGPLREAIPYRFPNARRIWQERVDLGEPAFSQRVYPDGVPTRTLSIPALHVGGWWDNTKRAQMPDWDVVSTVAPAATEQYLVLSATDHRDLMFSLDGRAAEDHLHGDDAALERYLPRMLELPISFLDHYLNDHDGAWPGPRVRYELTNAGSRTATTWPPAGTRARRLALTGAGRLIADAEAAGEQRTLEWTHDPHSPVPSLSANDFEILANLPDETQIHDRPDVCVFTSEPLEEPWDIAGRPELSVRVDGEGGTGDLIVTLCDHLPDGRAWMITEGTTRVRFAGHSSVSTSVVLGDIAYRVLPGHQLRLVISGSRSPRYTVHPGNENDVFTSGITNPARRSIVVGTGSDASLYLPILPEAV
jgi:putative CocE/NonD family hydrolase